MKILVRILLLIGFCTHAEVRLPKILSSHMVLQRDSTVKIWGWAAANETVTIKGDWLTEPVSVNADAQGNWHASIQTGPADNAPRTLTISAGNVIALSDVLFGEVWIGSGQSNMEMPLKPISGAYTGIKDSAKEIAAANYPNIRLFQVGNFSSQKPLEDVEPGIVMYGIPVSNCQWHPCTPETIPTFSSTAYFFARELHQKLDGTPIGIIDASWGGTQAETWTPTETLKALGGYDAQVQQAESAPQAASKKIPSRLYNGMIHPLKNFTIKGVVWYQGEGNSKRPQQYHALFSGMIQSWRQAFANDFPFYFVQISPFNYGKINAAHLRQAQLKTLALPKTGMVVTMDIGNLKDIHPKNKQEVGRRLALWALAKDYGKSVPAYSGPLYKSHAINGNSITVTFDHVGKGLTTSDGQAPSHFEIAGPDKTFHPATATIQNNQVIVSSPDVSIPTAVRYAFTSTAIPNLTNKTGLPASPFTMDIPTEK